MENNESNNNEQKNNNIQPVSTYTAINSHKEKSKSRIWKKVS